MYRPRSAQCSTDENVQNASNDVEISRTEDVVEPPQHVNHEIEVPFPDNEGMYEEECVQKDTDESGSDGKVSQTLRLVNCILQLQRCAGKQLVNELLRLCKDSSMDLNSFFKKYSSVAACNKIAEEHMERSIEQCGFQKFYIRDSNNDTKPLFKKDIASVLREQVRLAKLGDMHFRPNTTDSTGCKTTMSSKYIKEVYDSHRSGIMASKNSKSMWIEDVEVQSSSFIGFIQLYSDKTAMSLKANSMLAYPIHAVLLNSTPKFRRWLIDRGQTLVGFLPVQSCVYDDDHNADNTVEQVEEDFNTVHLDDYISPTSKSSGRVRKLETLHSAILNILQPLLDTSEEGFKVKDWRSHIWNLFPKIISYCCDIPEGKDVACVKHGGRGSSPCIRCHACINDFRLARLGVPRMIEDTVQGRLNLSTQCPSTDVSIENLNLSPVPSFLEFIFSNYRNVLPPDVYSIFTFESLHNLHLGISKLLKNCILQRMASDMLTTFPDGPPSKQKKMISHRSKLLMATNAILADIQKNYPAPGLQVDFSKKEASVQLNGFFMKEGIKGMLEGKNYRSVDMVFPFISAFIDRVTGFENAADMTRVCTLYTEIMTSALYDFPRNPPDSEIISEFKKKVQYFKVLTIKTFQDFCVSGLFTLKFHLLDHMVEDMERFGSLQVLDASAFEHYNTDIKAAIRRTSQRKSSCMEEAVSILGQSSFVPTSMTHITTSTDVDCNVDNSSSRQNGWNLVRDGERVTLSELRSLVYVSTDIYSSRTDVFKKHACIVELFPRDTFQVFIELLDEHLQEDGRHNHDSDVKLEFVQSGMVQGGFIPTMDDYNREENCISTERISTFQGISQRIFGTCRFGTVGSPKFSFVLLKGQDNNKEEIWVAQVLSLFHVRKRGMHDECAFVHYMQCTPPLDGLDDILHCISLRWATDNGVDYTLSSLPIRGDPVVVGEWYDIIPINCIIGTVHVLRSNFAVQAVTEELPWSHHRFHINRFYRNFG